MKKLFLLLCLSLVIGCDQDPLKDRSENLREAQPPIEQKPAEGLGQNIFVVETPEDVNFTVGKEKSIEIKTRIVSVDLDYAVSIDDLPDGASFDPATSIFTWTPNADSIGEDVMGVVLPLRITLQTTEEPILIKTTSINLSVYRDLSGRPEIKSISSLSDMSEGDRQFFQVAVEDLNSSMAKRPRLQVRKVLENDIGLLVEGLNLNPSQDSTNPYLWHFDLQVNANAELTSSIENFSFGLYAVSAIGVQSNVETRSFNINTKLRKPDLSWSIASEIKFTNGIEKEYEFSIIPPSMTDGVIANVEFVTDCSLLPGTAECECYATNRFTKNVCNIKWKPNVNGPMEQEFKIKTKLINPLNNNLFREDEFTRTIRVEL